MRLPSPCACCGDLLFASQIAGRSPCPTQQADTHAVYEGWRKDPEGFWAEAATGIHWGKAPAQTFDASQGVYGRWFPGATVNTCYNCVDRHVPPAAGASPH